MKQIARNIVIASIATSAMVSIGTAQASDAPYNYGDIGFERINIDVGADDFNFNNLMVRGGRRFSNYFGVEAELGRVLRDDKITINNVEIKGKMNWTAGVYAVGYIPVAENFDLIGRVGYRQDSTKFTAPATATNVSAQDGGVAWSVGGQMFFTEGQGVRLDYTQGQDLKTIRLGYTIKF